MPFLPIHDDTKRRWTSTPYVCWGTILVCVLVFIWQSGLDDGRSVASVFSYGFIPAVFFEHRELADHLVAIPPSATLLTSLFMHGDTWHLIGNMLFLYIFGDNVEDCCGHFRFAIFYLLTGVIATLTHAYMFENSAAPLIGASGAISGVLGGYLMLHPRQRVTALIGFIPLRLPVWIWIGVWFAMQAVAGSGMLGEDNVAYWAHIGGFVAGVVLIPLLKRDEAKLFGR